ncbi:MAG: alanine dehydrogenase [Parabacteroides sp.]|nr:alanine dehydrogenase [Parabacteroides sp.]
MISNLESNIPQELLKELGRAGGRLWIGIPREIRRGEQRLALTPEAVEILVMAGHKVWVETDAGLGISYSDNHYSEAGAEIVSSPAEVYQADIVLKILPPTLQEVAMMKPRATLFSFVQPRLISQEILAMMSAKRINAVAYELLKDNRQKSPVLNIISEIEGTAAITVAADLLSNTNGGKGILLGGIPGVSPTEVVIVGAGHAGTVAARAALALGASVKVFDNDINNLRTIQTVLGHGLFTSNFHPHVLHNALCTADVVIGAMRYIDSAKHYVVAEELISRMKRGSLIIDLRISQGGCFETTCDLPADAPEVFEQYGVLHYCRPNISNQVARTASMALSNVFVPLFLELGDYSSIQNCAKSDEGFKSGIYMYAGKLVNDYVASFFNLRANNIDIFML